MNLCWAGLWPQLPVLGVLLQGGVREMPAMPSVSTVGQDQGRGAGHRSAVLPKPGDAAGCMGTFTGAGRGGGS